MPLFVCITQRCRSSGIAGGQHDKPCRIARLNPHEDVILLCGTGLGQCLLHIGWRRNQRTAHIKDDVTRFHASLGGWPARPDFGDNDTFASRTRNAGRRREGQAERRLVGFLLLGRSRLRLTLLRYFAERHGYRLLLTLAHQRELGSRVRCHRPDHAHKSVRIFHLLTVNIGDDIASENARLGGRTVGLYFSDKRAFRLLQAEGVSHLFSNRLNLHANPSAGDDALVAELGDNIFHRVGWNGESDADRSARWRENRGVHADYVAIHIEAWATRVAPVDRRIDLTEVIVWPGADTTSARRDNSGGNRAVEAEGIANSDHPITDSRGLLSELHERKVVPALNLDQREVGLWICADHFGRIGLAGIGLDLDFLCLLDDMIVRDRVAVCADEEARALAHCEIAVRPRRLHVTRHAELAEEAVCRRPRLDARCATAIIKAHHFRTTGLFYPHRDDCGFDLFHEIPKPRGPLRRFGYRSADGRKRSAVCGICTGE